MNIPHAAPSDMIHLSDLFRRSASFVDADKVEKLVECVRDFGCQVTHYRGEYGVDFPENNAVLQEIETAIRNIDELAGSLRKTHITLPLSCFDPIAKIIFDEIIDQTTWRVSFNFNMGEYDYDTSEIGTIDDRIPTILDEGLRGIVPVSDAVLQQWACETRQPS